MTLTDSFFSLPLCRTYPVTFSQRKGDGFQNHADPHFHPGFAIYALCELNKLYNLSWLQLPHLKMGINNSYLAQLLRQLYKPMQAFSLKVLEKMVAVINITLHRCSIRVENKRVFRSVIKMMDVSKEPQASQINYRNLHSAMCSAIVQNKKKKNLVRNGKHTVIKFHQFCSLNVLATLPPFASTYGCYRLYGLWSPFTFMGPVSTAEWRHLRCLRSNNLNPLRFIKNLN